jgi:hypothetical protein
MPEVLLQSHAARVLEEHKELRTKVGELRHFLESPRPECGEKGSHTWAACLSRKLVGLHDQLFRHFRFEDEGGLVEEISFSHPRAALAIEELCGDHAHMLRRLRGLMGEALDYSEGRRPADPSLRLHVSDLLDHLAEHEREETDLIERLEFEDIGAAD